MSFPPGRFGAAARRGIAPRALPVLLAVAMLGFVARTAGAAPPSPPVATGAERRAEASDRVLAAAPSAERETLLRLMAAEAWPRRAIAAVRLERFSDDEARSLLVALLGDAAWQVRAFATATLGRRGMAIDPAVFEAEDDPRVLRTALRHRVRLDTERLARGVRYLARQDDLEQKMLAVELAAASGDPALVELGTETVRTVILRMTRADAGALSPRLAAVTGAPDLRRHRRWQRWLMKTGRGLRLGPAYAIPENAAPPPLTAVAGLDTERFADLEEYITSLRARRVDLVICLDTTASMADELAQAQGGLDDMMLFAHDVVALLRVGIMAYRDRRAEYETRGWDLTGEIDVARERLWRLSAYGGGDRAEAVYPAMKLAYTGMTWIPTHDKVLILVGDAPPHVGFGTQCVDMARRAHENARVTTHAIRASDDDVEHFCEIAGAGGGRCTTLADDGSLVTQIAGLTLGERFGEEMEEFFELYLRLCR